uniref:Solute carrier family 22 member 7a n=1 Tax=Latimeria chalumnae TaxID=7897 RepID=H3AN83_LATCH
MRFEELLFRVGSFGRYQILIIILLCLPRIILPWHFLLHNFLGAVPPHHCTIPDLEALANLTQDEKLVVSIPRDSRGIFSSCKMFSKPQFHLLFSDTCQGVSNGSSVEQCQHGWIYNHSQFRSTIVAQWNLVCEKKGLNQASATFFFIGVMLGAAIFGYLSDRFGRKPMLLVSFVATTLFGISAAFSTSYLMFAVMRTLCGMGLTGMSIISMALSIEWIDIKHRTFTGTFSGLSWSVGNMLLPLIAYLVWDWQWLLLAVTSPCLLAMISWWWIPESARWLLANGDTKKAHHYLSKCAETNGKKEFVSTITTEMLSKIIIVEESYKNYSYLHLVKTPKMRKLTLCLGIVWFGMAFTCYGISFKITGFGLDMYLTQFIYATVEVPVKVATYFVLDKIGRRNCQAWSLIITGTLIAINTAVPSHLGLVRSLVAILGKGFSEVSFTTAFLYTAELYPTVVRQSGLGYSSFMGRLGGSVAPMVILMEDSWTHLPPVIFSIAAVFCGLIAFFLWETTNIQLPELIEDVEQKRDRTDPGCRTGEVRGTELSEDVE